MRNIRGKHKEMDKGNAMKRKDLKARMRKRAAKHGMYWCSEGA